MSDLADDDRRSAAADDERRRSLPPGSDTVGDPDEIDGNVRFEQPFEDAPGEGRLSPGGDNPPPGRGEDR